MIFKRCFLSSEKIVLDSVSICEKWESCFFLTFFVREPGVCFPAESTPRRKKDWKHF